MQSNHQTMHVSETTDKAKVQQSKIDSAKLKLQKVKLFMSASEQQMPVITNMSKVAQLSVQIRRYFNDQQLLFYKDQVTRNNYFKTQQYQKQLQTIFTTYVSKLSSKIQQSKILNTELDEEAIKSNTTNKQWKIDFIDFIEYWVISIPKLNVFNQQYNQIVKDQIDNYSQILSQQISKNTSFIQENQTQVIQKATIKKQTKNQNLNHIQQKTKQISVKQQNTSNAVQKIQIQDVNDTKNQCSQQNFEQQEIIEEIHQQHTHKNQFIQSRVFKCQISDQFQHYLKAFYNFYSKKIVNSMKNQSFQVLEKYYSTMSLTKFMMYCKDLKIAKTTKQITIKYLQQIFKKYQNIDHALTFHKFSQAVKQILSKIYLTEDLISTKGYQFIGVLSKQTNQKVMKSIGINVPMNKIVFKRAQQARSLSKVIQSKAKDQMKKSRLNQEQNMFPSLGLKNGGYSFGYEMQANQNNQKNDLKNPIFMSQNDRKQQKLLQNITIPKLNKLKPSKQVDLKLNQLIDDQYDPYLKRYNEKHGSSHDKHHMYQGVMKRIDQRIENVVRKVR